MCVSVSVVLWLSLDFYVLHSVPRKSSGTIDVIGGQTATISRVEGRRRHNLDGNNIQVHRIKTLERRRTLKAAGLDKVCEECVLSSPNLSCVSLFCCAGDR